MRKDRLILRARIHLLVTALVLLVLCGSIMRAPAESFHDDEHLIVRVYFEDLETAHSIAIWTEPLEADYEKGYLVLQVSPEDYRLLNETGLRVESDSTLKEQTTDAQREVPPEAETIPGFLCYRTVEETYATGQSIAATHPDLATWIDVGDSWEMTAGLGGYDMMVLRLTNSALLDPKPKIFITSSIHAREYTPAELITRLAEYLVNNYGINADVTWLLDYHEVHLMLNANPDGRKKAETGLYWRKNTNQNYCSPTSNYRGADLNRNFQFLWNCCGGSSGYECDETYRGPYPVSEPEIQAIQNYIFDQFPDQRGPDLDDPAPLDATGIYLDIHSSGRLILWPWGFTYDMPPNGTQLQTLGRKLAYFNGHTPKQAIGLYPTDGTSDDFGYGELGLASYVYELGTTFFQSCSYFENVIVPTNIPSLIYAIKVARTPYMTPAGPDATQLSLSAGSSLPGVLPGTLVTLSGVIDDTRYNNSVGTEPTQNIAAAEYYLNVPPWVTNSNPLSFPMYPSDGNFDSKVEGVEAMIDTTNFSRGQHIIFVRGQDAAGNWGAFTTIFLYIEEAVELDLTPGNTVIPRGESLSYWVRATNNTDRTQCFYFWTNVNLPNGNIHPPDGTLLGPYYLCLSAFQYRSKHFSHKITPGAPLGSYTYNAYVGSYPTVWAEGHFNFTVIKTAEQEGSENLETRVSADFGE